MSKSKQKYTRAFDTEMDRRLKDDRRNEPWNQPYVLMREAAEEIKHKNRRLEIANAKLEMVYLIASLVQRAPTERNDQCGASQESIVSRLERAIAPAPAPVKSGIGAALKRIRANSNL